MTATEQPGNPASVRIPIAIAITAAIVRLAPLQWLHPLNWDELEFYRATRWIAEGLVPFRDFWEHHSPLTWFVFAPFTLLTDSPGVNAIVMLRWVQIPVWIATFWLANIWMRDADLTRFARWAAMAIALSSSFFMIAAVEYRIDPLGCALYLGGLVLWRRGTSRAMFGAGMLFCLAGLANLRLGPLLVITVLLLRVVDTRERAWKGITRANWMFAGGIVALLGALQYFIGSRSLHAFWRQVIIENYIGERTAQPIVGGFFHRLLVPFGVRVIGSDRLFELAAVDLGGIVIVLAGLAGMFLALRRWRTPDEVVVTALLQAASLLFIARMKFIYNYHFEIVVIMMLPLLALVVERIPRRGIVIGVLLLAWSVNAFASFFRGKEHDRALQDFVMREVHARTKPGERVFAGMPWALRRPPVYRFWFLPELARQLVKQGNAPRYSLPAVLRNPPAAVVADRSVLVWLTIVQRELMPFFLRHYIPMWPTLWVPGMNTVVSEERPRFEWIVPRDGNYRLFASTALAKHRWFHDPQLVVAGYARADVVRETLTLPAPVAHPALAWRVDGRTANVNPAIALRKGQRLSVEYAGSEPLGVILLPGNDTVLFRYPPPGVTLEGATTRRTHVPDFNARIEP